jgi:receptor expression-enhancing protein 5/6
MSSKIRISNQQQNPILKKIDEHLKIIVDKTGIPAKYIMSVLGVSLLLTIVGFLDRYITCLVAIILPTTFSIKAIETKEEDDDKLWLTYWTIFAIFSFLDLFSGCIIKILPFYFMLKLIFLVWCFMPNTKGAIIIYNKLIKPFILKNESKFDKGAKKLIQTTQKVEDFVKNEIIKNKNKIKHTEDNFNKILKTE